jgi:hypothetical protein
MFQTSTGEQERRRMGRGHNERNTVKKKEKREQLQTLQR